MERYTKLIEDAQAYVAKAKAILDEYEGQEMPQEQADAFDDLMAKAAEAKQRAEQLRLVADTDADLQLRAAEVPASPAPQISKDDKTFYPVYHLKYGEEKEVQRQVMTDLLGGDYRQQIDGQNLAFAKYLRWGEKELERDEVHLLRKQIFPWNQIEYLLTYGGMSVSQIKTTMVEAQGTLGGYAVPPNVQANIQSRLPGMTVVRGSGATVVDLTAGNSIDVPVYTGGDSRYRGAIRGVWGAETTTPTAKNATLGMTPVVAHVYTYKVSFSQSLVEDASNLVALVQSDIADVLAIDEDDAFLVGDGANKPHGILPSSANGNSLSTVNSGNASTLTSDGLIELSDGIDVQYMDNAIFVFNKATGTAIRKLKSGDGEYLFDRDLENNKRTLLGYPFKRTEAMPDIASGAYPILFGDFSAYWIVQKAGLTIARFQDSNTGINNVEYHVRRRVGGRLVKTWQLAVQYVSA